ncbi:short-chain type dehydrogenase/reductase domain protein [Mycobacterium ulcerans str. Harvey]|uniref:Short-chain type dehydrogenase/reductase domain protein n=1 Tax=Mycobacterium ulcerans str. Harvey TaxID=1299332 RepID=A0ABP3AF50_MYCUL|nr:short-chain type dehydrogenase/reductase domain protein [Mycobacterium ulcerans str. Harvey]
MNLPIPDTLERVSVGGHRLKGLANERVGSVRLERQARPDHRASTGIGKKVALAYAEAGPKSPLRQGIPMRCRWSPTR